MWSPRSLLYVPASNVRALAKAASLDADAIIVDLEDSVAPDAKAQAREAMAVALGRGFGGKPTIVRINAPGTAWAETDLVAAIKAGAHAVLVPKIDTVAQAEAIAAATVPTPVWLMIETPTAVLGAADLARVRGVEAFVLGLNDLAAALRATVGPDRAELIPHIAHTLVAARGGEIAVYDGVPASLDDAKLIAAECIQAVRMGLDGKTLVHPAQIAPANSAFTPNADTILNAQAVIQAWERRKAGSAVTSHAGRLIEAMHVDTARRALARGGAQTS